MFSDKEKPLNVRPQLWQIGKAKKQSNFLELKKKKNHVPLPVSHYLRLISTSILLFQLWRSGTAKKQSHLPEHQHCRYWGHYFSNGRLVSFIPFVLVLVFAFVFFCPLFLSDLSLNLDFSSTLQILGSQILPWQVTVIHSVLLISIEKSATVSFI